MTGTAYTLRDHARSLFQTGIDAADPYRAVVESLTFGPDGLEITLNSSVKPYSARWSKIHIIAFGKAACPMLKAAMTIIPKNLIGQTLAVTNVDNVSPIPGANVIGASHPLPDAAGYKAARQCAAIARNAGIGELVLVLISGGGSALLPYPAGSISLHDKIQTTDLLLASGANINQMNCVRKHLSHLKGGGLCRMIAPADCHALILSDVIGDDLSTIASGPTTPDPTTYHQAIDILKSKNLWDKVPEAVRLHLERGRQGEYPETPKPDDPCFQHESHTLIGSNRISVDAMLKHAGQLGFKAILFSDNLCGEANDAAKKFLAFAQEQSRKLNTKPLAIIAGGETTVTLRGQGKGGRNQEMALAFAVHAKTHGFNADWVFLSGGTDGRDGPTEAAGGLVDSGTISRLIDSKTDPAQYLANNDSYSALQSANDLLITGATGTNVADLQVLLIRN